MAIIGTGATAIQCVPHVGAHAKQLYVFQRTPSSVDVRGNKPTDREWAQTLKPGWQRARRENFNDVVTGQPFEEDLVTDGWTDIFRNLQSMTPLSEQTGQVAMEEAERRAEIADFQKMNEIRARVDATVKNPRAADALKPWYRQFCKRPTFNDEYLPTFNRPNVELVDTSASGGVERITKRGVVANGVEYPVDCIIFATGFEITSAPKRRMGIEIYGRDGKSLWRLLGEGSAHAARLREPRLPELVLHRDRAERPLGEHDLDVRRSGAARRLHRSRGDGARREARAADRRGRGRRGSRRCAASRASTAAFSEACTPGYYNNEGEIDTPGSLSSEAYAPGANAFNAMLEKWRADGRLEGLELRLTPVVGAGRVHLRVAAREGRLRRARPEDAGVAVVDLAHAHACRVERGDQARIDGVDARRRLIERRRVGDAAAPPAAMEGEHPVPPDVGVGCLRSLHDARISGLGVRPEPAVAPAERAVAVENPVGGARQLHPHGSTVAGRSDHGGTSTVESTPRRSGVGSRESGGAAMIRTQGLTHIHLVVRDLDRSLRFYQGVFGMQEQFRDGPSMVFLNTPGSGDLITLNADPDEAREAGVHGGIAHFGFRLAEGATLDAAIGEVERAGGKLLRRGEHAPGVPFAYVADPDGYVIEL